MHCTYVLYDITKPNITVCLSGWSVHHKDKLLDPKRREGGNFWEPFPEMGYREELIIRTSQLF